MDKAELRPFKASEHPEHLRPYAGQNAALASFPPVVKSTELMGYVKDASNIGYSRDIGRSSMLKGQWYYMFGDSFIKNRSGEFIGVQSTTAAVVPNCDCPLESTYLNVLENEMVDAFIPLTKNEHALESVTWEDSSKPRVTLWAFGGMVEILNNGWVWFQKGVINEDGGEGENKYKGTGLARIGVKPDGSLTSFRIGAHEPMMFGEEEPRVGTFSSIIEGDYIYLWGDHGKGCGDGVILSRVRKNLFQNKKDYTYWDGEEYVEDWRAAKVVLKNMQSGSIFRSSLFGEERPWVFIGCTFECKSLVMMGAAATLEGPYHEKAIFNATGIDCVETIMYCVYPHPWVFDEREGQLMITWSEQWPGGVVGAKVSLKMDLAD